MSRLKNYLKNERIHYSVKLKAGKNKSIQLFEHIEGFNHNTSSQIGVVYTWRADLVHKFLNGLILVYAEDSDILVISTNMSIFDFASNKKESISSLEWKKEYKLNTEISMKLLLAMKLVSSMESKPRIESALEILESLSEEETSFWVWKVLSLQNRALSGFKTMYL